MNIHRKKPKEKVSKRKYTDAEKMARRRKVEKLHDLADTILRRWCVSYSPKSCSSPKTVATTIKRLIRLSPGWTEEDYKAVHKSLSDYGHILKPAQNSILESELCGPKAMDKPQSIFKIGKREYATELLYNASLLQGCLFSLLYLCDIPNDMSATLMVDVCREIGRTLYLNGQRNIRHNLSTALCLMLLPNDYLKPDWAKELVLSHFAGNAEPEIVFGSADEEY